jgi:acetyltransferase-like isoleucine patch superfamily enzyme
MDEIMGWASSMGLPCIHIENFCGNRFNHVCSRCGKLDLVCCHKIINAQLAGHHDIIGIAWTIETKHKVNKIKKQDPKLSPQQSFKSLVYSVSDIPSVSVNEDNAADAFRFLQSLSKAGKNNMISPQALIHPGAKVSETAKVFHFCVVSQGATIGPYTFVGNNCYVGHGVFIHDGVSIQGNSFIPSGVTIMSNAFIGPNVTFCNIKYPPSGSDKSEHEIVPTLICQDAIIGAGAVILPGVTVHPKCRVGAGAVVTKDCTDPSGWYCGNPAAFRKGDKPSNA